MLLFCLRVFEDAASLAMLVTNRCWDHRGQGRDCLQRCCQHYVFRAELHAFAGVLRTVVSADSNEIQSGIKKRTWHLTLRNENGQRGGAQRPLHKFAGTFTQLNKGNPKLPPSSYSVLEFHHTWETCSHRTKWIWDHRSSPADHQVAKVLSVKCRCWFPTWFGGE